MLYLNIFNTNIGIINKYYTNLISVITSLDSIPDSYQIISSRNGRPNVKLELNGQEIPIHSLYNPEQEAASWVRQISASINEAKHILLNGFGLGYHIEALLDNFPDKKFYVYEPDSNIFNVAVHTRKLSRILKHANLHMVAIGSDEAIMQQLANNLVTQLSGPLEVVNAPIYLKVYKEDINKLKQILVDSVKSKRTDLATYSKFSLEWTKNIFYNIKYVKQSSSIDILKYTYPSTPAIIVGSGPSLAYDLDILKQLKNKAIIIAAGTSTQALLAAKIEPDIIVSMDGGLTNYKAFHSLDTFDIPIVYAPILYRGILTDEHKYYSYAILGLDPITPRLIGSQNEQIIFSPTYSVTGLCIQLAVFMGCPQIIFTGQDLSFPNDQYYSSNINHAGQGSTEAIVKEADIRVVNVNGGTNPSNHNMYVTLKNIEELLVDINNTKFINSSRGGAQIRGAEFIPLEQLQLEKLPLREADELRRLFIVQQEKKNKQKEIIELNIKSDYMKIKQLKRLVSSLCEQFESLEEKALSSKQQKDKAEKIIQEWNKIIHNTLFKPYVEFALNSIFFAKQGYMHEIQNVCDFGDRLDMIKQHIGSLNKIIQQYLDELIEVFEKAIEENSIITI